MPVRFRRTIKIFPGVKMNLSKGGVSFTFGSKGYHVNVGKHGVRQTVGIPGTGISHTSYLGKDDDNDAKDRDEKEKDDLGLSKAAMMAMAANAMADKDNDDNDKDEDEADAKTRTKPKRRRKTRPRKTSSPLRASFIFLGALVFFCVGAAVLGLIPPDFLSNVGHVMVEWAKQFNP